MDDKDIVLALLHLIRKNECQSALDAWFDHCQSKPEVYQNCLYAQKAQKPENCSPCLESKLRTLSLYQHDGDAFERSEARRAGKG